MRAWQKSHLRRVREILAAVDEKLTKHWVGGSEFSFVPCGYGERLLENGVSIVKNFGDVESEVPLQGGPVKIWDESQISKGPRIGVLCGLDVDVCGRCCVIEEFPLWGGDSTYRINEI